MSLSINSLIDVTVGFEACNYSVVEGNEPLYVSLKLDSVAAKDVSVQVEHFDGTAKGITKFNMQDRYHHYHAGPTDFESVIQDVLFPAGISNITLPVTVVNDSILEAIEFFYMRILVPIDLVDAVHLNDNTSLASVTIIDNDCEFKFYFKVSIYSFCPPYQSTVVIVKFQSAVYGVNESSGQVAICLLKIGVSDITISVVISVHQDTALGNPESYMQTYNSTICHFYIIL